VGNQGGGRGARRTNRSQESTIRYSDDMRLESTAGRLLREARRRAGLSQVELAARAGVTQSVISAYESGHRQPAVPTLAALIEATGHELLLSLGPVPEGLARLSGPVGRRVRSNRHALVAAAAAHGITRLRVFGSVARGDDRPDSDVDLLADLPPGLGLFGLGRAEAELEGIVSAPVDLAPAESLKPQIRKRVEQELVPL
jgi:predicted nucleotidyltransferase/DNA-binding XRE family transcriptional regulator